MRGAATALVVVAVVSADDAAAQGWTELREAVEVLESPTPSLESYYTMLPFDVVIDPSYRPHAHISASTDLDGDGNEDLVLLGFTHPTSDVTAENYRPQPGRVFLGDGDGGFRRAPADLFPVDTLNTVLPRKVPFGDLNGDGLPDMFIAGTGWDAEPLPGEQNRLYLSRPGGGWRDATSELPQLSDYSHSAAIGDIRGLGIPDILVGNYGGDPDHVLPYVLLNNGDETFSLDRSNLPVGPDETLNFDSRVISFTGTVLTDLDGDELPELIALGEGYRGYFGIEAVGQRRGVDPGLEAPYFGSRRCDGLGALGVTSAGRRRDVDLEGRQGGEQGLGLAGVPRRSGRDPGIDSLGPRGEITGEIGVGQLVVGHHFVGLVPLLQLWSGVYQRGGLK